MMNAPRLGSRWLGFGAGMAFTACIGSNAAQRPVMVDPPQDATPHPDATSPAPDGASATPDAVAAPDIAPPTPDAAPPDAAPPKDAGPDWSLPPCDRACDRFVDCAVDACVGYDWGTAGGLTGQCAAVCDADLAAQILNAADCPAAIAAVTPRLPDFPTDCLSNRCAAACDRAVACIVDICPAIAEDAGGGIAAGCKSDCDPGTIDFVNSFADCQALVDAIAANDPNFQTGCYGPPPGACATVDECAPFARHLSECIVAQCDGHADAFEPGLEAAIDGYCLGNGCPAEDDVVRLGDASLSCDSPELATLGANEPFTRICDGTIGVDAATIRAACEKLLACPGGQAVGTVESCLGGLALAATVDTLVPCITDAGDCAAAFACLQ